MKISHKLHFAASESLHLCYALQPNHPLTPHEPAIGQRHLSQELLTQICQRMPDDLTPFVIHYLTTQYGKEAPSSCTLVWSKRKVQPTYEGLQAYLDEIGFQSRMEAVVARAIIEQPEDIVDFAIGSFADCAASVEVAQPESALSVPVVTALDVKAASASLGNDESGEDAANEGRDQYPECPGGSIDILNDGCDSTEKNSIQLTPAE